MSLAPPPPARRPRLATIASLAVGLGWLGHGTWLGAWPPADRPLGGPVLGVETAIVPGATALSWTGPFGRQARVEGNGRFELWREPLWSGTPTELQAEGGALAEGRLVVDRSVPLGESLSAAWAAAPGLWSLALAGLVLVLAAHGTPSHAAALAGALALARALSPAWRFDSDPARYWASARQILAGQWPDPMWPPGWPLVLAPAAAIGEDPRWGRILGALLFAACPPLAARVAAQTGEGTGPLPASVAAALVTALSFELVGFAPSLYAEPLFVLLGLAFLAARRDAPMGLLAAGAALTRAHALGVVLLARRLRPALLIALLAPVGLWSAALSAHVGHVVIISDNAGMNLWIGHRPGADGDWHDPGPAPAEGYGAAAIAAIRADPGAAAARVLGNVSRLWSASRSDRTLASRPPPLPLLPFAGLVALAALGLWRHPRRDLALWLASTTAITAIFLAPVRYKLGLYPALLPLAGQGLSTLVAWCAPSRMRATPRRATDKGDSSEVNPHAYP